MTGIQIDVCDGTKCQTCGRTPATGSAAWGTVNCAGAPLRGSSIVLRGTNSGALNFCEIKIEGSYVAPDVTILGSQGTPPFAQSQDWALVNAYDNNNARCYASVSVPGEGKFSIDYSEIYQVRLLNRQNFMRE